MTIEFKWQKKCIDYVIEQSTSTLEIDILNAIYAEVTEELGTGKLLLGKEPKYTNFMENKWRVVYGRLLKHNHDSKRLIVEGYYK